MKNTEQNNNTNNNIILNQQQFMAKFCLDSNN